MLPGVGAEPSRVVGLRSAGKGVVCDKEQMDGCAGVLHQFLRSTSPGLWFPCRVGSRLSLLELRRISPRGDDGRPLEPEDIRSLGVAAFLVQASGPAPAAFYRGRNSPRLPFTPAPLRARRLPARRG